MIYDGLMDWGSIVGSRGDDRVIIPRARRLIRIPMMMPFMMFMSPLSREGSSRGKNLMGRKVSLFKQKEFELWQETKIEDWRIL